MKKALVLGVNGQDGSFLAERLNVRGYSVLGVDLQDSITFPTDDRNINYEKLDIRNAIALKNLLISYQPDIVFHVAAMHGSEGTMYETIWQDMLLVNMGSVHVVLEYLRTEATEATLVYANSGKVFGPLYPQRITEHSPMQSSCLYTITKMGARDLIAYYRDRYGTRCSNIFLFNHESERRPATFFIPKLTRILAESIEDSTHYGSVFTLDFECDWGSAEEYMDIAIDISEKAAGEDFVLGTGITWRARKFVDELFSKWGLNFRNHVVEKTQYSATDSLHASYLAVLDKLEKAINRKPQRSIMDVCNTILIKSYHVDTARQKIKP